MAEKRASIVVTVAARVGATADLSPLSSDASARARSRMCQFSSLRLSHSLSLQLYLRVDSVTQ